MAGGTFGLAVGILIVSYKVLKPRKPSIQNLIGSGAGFLWIHILCVTVALQGFIAVGMVDMEQRLRAFQGLSWRSPVFLVLTLLTLIAYIIIFRIELARLKFQKIVEDTS